MADRSGKGFKGKGKGKGHQQPNTTQQKPGGGLVTRASVIELDPYMNKKVQVSFVGGRLG